MKWIIKKGDEYMEMDADGLISRPAIGWKASGQWRVTGAVEYNNFGNVICRLTLADVKAACNSLEWQYKNGKQRIFITDLDHGTAREWRSPNHTVHSVVDYSRFGQVLPCDRHTSVVAGCSGCEWMNREQVPHG